MSIAITLSVSAGCNEGDSATFQKVGGSYPPVTEAQLKKAKYGHRTGQAKFAFDWSFNDNKFVIEGKKIPQDLLDAMLGPGSTGSKIEGTWTIKDERIHFDVKSGDKETRKCSLSIYFTGVIRIETKKAQYVF